MKKTKLRHFLARRLTLKDYLNLQLTERWVFSTYSLEKLRQHLELRIFDVNFQYLKMASNIANCCLRYSMYVADLTST